MNDRKRRWSKLIAQLLRKCLLVLIPVHPAVLYLSQHTELQPVAQRLSSAAGALTGSAPENALARPSAASTGWAKAHSPTYYERKCCFSLSAKRCTIWLTCGPMTLSTRAMSCSVVGLRCSSVSTTRNLSVL